MAKHKGYLYVPIITDIRQHLIKHRRSMPDLTAKSHRNLRADENPEFTRTPCFIIAATAIATHREHERRGSKIQQLTGTVKLDKNDSNSNNQTQFKVLPKLPLPKNLKIIQWNDSIENKLKQITTNNIDTSEFRQGVKTNKKTFVNSNYFAIKKDEKSVRESIANTLLNCWKKMLDAYTKSNKNTSKSFKYTLLSIMSKLANRFEFDLSHIQHWQHENVNGFKALTTFTWERIMKQYYKLFIRTLEIGLNIVEEEKELHEEEETFAKEVCLEYNLYIIYYLKLLIKITFKHNMK